MEVIFYQLTNAHFEKLLVQLVQKSLNQNWRVEIRFNSTSKLESFDSFLWSFTNDSFLAHGSMEDPFPEKQPILLSLDNMDNSSYLDENTKQSVNGAQVFFCVSGATAPQPENYDKIIIIFYNDQGEEYQKIRQQWRLYKEKQCKLKYWAQQPNGKWEEKA